eukprot:3052847-Rhodomonas_salina.1
MGFYNPWMMKAESYLAAKLQDWAVALDDGAMTAHHNCPVDAPVIPGDPAATAAAQAEVIAKRQKVQEKLHELLISTCNE